MLLFASGGGWGGGVDGDLWWAGTHVTTVVGSGVIGKYFAANHYDYALLYNWNYITENGTNRIGIICPDGWRLPTRYEIVALVKLSGFPSAGVNASISTSAGSVTNIDGTRKNGRWFGPGVATGGSDANLYTYTTDTHLFFPCSGYTDHINNALATSLVGSHGGTWSSSPSDSSRAYYIVLYQTSIHPQYNYYRTRGYPIRCVADAL